MAQVWRSPEVMGDLALVPEHAREVLVKHLEAVKSGRATCCLCSWDDVDAGEADGVSKPARREGDSIQF